MALPQEFGGLGYTLEQAHRETRRLAAYAPATALCLNMHHYWVGTAADSWRMGDKTVGFILEEAGKGEVFAAGHAEPGNETSIVMSATKAEKVPGGYTFTGRKAFGSLTPVWTRLGLHGLDTSDPAHPKVVHGFLTRDAKGVTIKDTWDVMGMRATRSDDTILDVAFIPDDHIVRVVPGGPRRRRLLHPLDFRLGAWRVQQRLLRPAQRMLELPSSRSRARARSA